MFKQRLQPISLPDKTEGTAASSYLIQSHHSGESGLGHVFEELAIYKCTYSSDNDNSMISTAPAEEDTTIWFGYTREGVDYVISTLELKTGESSGGFTPFNYTPEYGDVLYLEHDVFNVGSGAVIVSIQGTF